ncbi:thiol-disulfide oxidoreductase DCC family protein [Halomonas sp. LS-001]
MSRLDALNAKAPVTLFYDGHCPFCRVEVDWLARHRHHRRIGLVDIQEEAFLDGEHGALFGTMMGKLHVLDNAGHWYIGMDASRALYAVLGYQRLVRFSCLPGINRIMDAGYRLFARYRIRLGRWWDKRKKT